MIWALHGNLGSPADWKGLEEACGMEVRALDLYSARQPMENVGAWLREMAADDAEPLLLGYSMGGRLALEALVEDSSAWAAAVIVSAQPGLADPAERQNRLVSDGAWASMLEKGEQGWANFQTAWDLQPVLAGRVRPSVNREWREGLDAGFDEWSLGQQPDLFPMLGRVDIPVLWATGEEDQKFSKIGERACEVLPQGEHVVVEGVGHRVPWEARDLFPLIVRTFAEKSGLL